MSEKSVGERIAEIGETMTPEEQGHLELLLAVDELAEAMKRKLNARREKHTGRLEDAPRRFFQERLSEEARELIAADVGAQMGDYPVEDVRDEAADVANFAMFVWIRRRRIAAAQAR